MRPSSDSGEGFGALLRRHRSASGLTQEELAERSMLSIRAIANMEAGRTTRPYRRSVRRLADALELLGPDRELLEREARAGLSGQLGRLVSAAADLNGDASASIRPGSRYPASVPRQLPPTVLNLAGRKRELSLLTGMLTPRRRGNSTVRTVAIVGAAGVGKTTLAVHWGHQVAHQFPDGQLYVNLRGFDESGDPMAPSEALGGFLTALARHPGAIPATIEARVGLYRSLLASRTMLIVLDDARSPEQLRPLLPASSSSMVVVTSRAQLAGLVAANGAYPLHLDALRDTEAYELLRNRLGEDRLACEPRAARELVELSARLPLALATVAARAAASPALSLAGLAAELRLAGRRLDALETGDPATSMRTVYLASYQQLSSPAARMFRLLSVHPGPHLGLTAAASLAAVSAAQCRALLRELAFLHLVSEQPPGRFGFGDGDLLRAYAAERADEEDADTDVRTAFERLLEHYLLAAHAAAAELLGPEHAHALFPPQSGVIREEIANCGRALAWFEAECQVIDALAARTSGTVDDAQSRELQAALAVFLRRRARRADRCPAD